MKRNVINVIGKVGVLFVIGIISGCASMNYAKSDPISAGRYDVRAGGFGYEEKWKEEAKKNCPNGFSITERHSCGSNCWQGTIQCEQGKK